MENGRPRFVVAEVVEWLRDHEREEARRGDSPTESQERSRKLRADADYRELQIKERRRDLVPAVDFDEVVEEIATTLASVSAGQLQSFERDMLQLKTPAEARRLTERMHAALMEGAKKVSHRLRRLAAGGGGMAA
ncbi:MAG: hypothetical protein HOP28_15930 [Gemmatimonadales bacterium]|nr:hypothetical protein [Gemmatimonadales bacterium]